MVSLPGFTPWFQHTAFDGLVSVTAFYFTYTALEGTGGKWQGTSVIRQLPPCQELDIELDNYLQTEIRRLQVECVEQVSRVGWGGVG